MADEAHPIEHCDGPGKGPAAEEGARPSLLFLTYADRRYDMFAVPYAFFALRSCPDARVEILLEDHDAFLSSHGRSVERLRSMVGDRVLFRQSSTIAEGRRVSPNVVRFVEEPVSGSDYVYIGDIDLMVLDDVLVTHLELIRKHGLPFSNIVRPGSVESGTPKLSGLHFCRSALMYPLPELGDLDLLELNDEHVLHTIMSRKGSMVPESFTSRPGCGIHMSLNRDPAGRCSGPVGSLFESGRKPDWAGRECDARFLDLLDSDEFRLLWFDLSFEFRLLLSGVEALARDEQRFLHRTCASWLVDRRFCVPGRRHVRQELERARDEAWAEGDRVAAESAAARVNELWPRCADGYLSRARMALEDGRTEFGLECLLHYLELNEGSVSEAYWLLHDEYRQALLACPGAAGLPGRDRAA